MISFVVNLRKYYAICYRHIPKGALAYIALYSTEVLTDMTLVKTYDTNVYSHIPLVKHINMFIGFSAG